MVGDHKVHLDRLGDPTLMRTVWKKGLRGTFRTLRLAELHLAQDPLYFAAHEWDLSAITSRLADDVRSGAYTAERPKVVRAAKGIGLTRPIAHLSFRDALLFKTLVALGENSLIQSMPSWSRMGRRDPDNDSDLASDSGWFRGWLKRQGQLWVISETWEWLVETDISNFFPSVDGRAVLALVRSSSNLGEDCIRLLGQQLRAFSPSPEYRELAAWGLPQERSDASRVLAHSLLRDLDEEFRVEGDANRYSRWMDDVIVGAATREEAVVIVGRVQDALEKLGLYPNRAKTRIYRATEFQVDYMKDVNDYLGAVHDQVEAGQPTDLVTFQRQLRIHLRMPVSRRPKAWDRVLRRFYTESRRLGVPYLLPSWPVHLKSEPTSAAHIFDYLSVFRVTEGRVNRLHAVLSTLSPRYGDVHILALEYLAQAPAINDAPSRQAASVLGFELLERAMKREDWEVGSGAVVVLGKYGQRTDLERLLLIFESQMKLDTPLRQQAFAVLLGAGFLGSDDIDEAAPHSTFDSAVHLRFLRRLHAGDVEAVNRALGLLEPALRRHPDRNAIRPRALFLSPLVRDADPIRYDRITTARLAKLRKNSLRLRDFNVERWLTGRRQL